MSTPRRLAVIGLDCATPRLLFDELAEQMPNLSRLRAAGSWGALRSTVPPITVPAWSCLYSGRTPGELGIYGFRNRADHSYRRLVTAGSQHVRVPRLWDMLGDDGRRSVLIGVPGTYPLPQVKGTVIGDFLTPSSADAWAAPAEIGRRIERELGPYLFDVDDFRTDDKARIAQRLFDLTEQRFAVARQLAVAGEWDLFAMVDMGPDRLHHGFWSTYDPGHPRYRPDDHWTGLFADYYRALDDHLGRLVELFDDDVAVLVVSDHGAQPMIGGFCINEWLIREGLLRLRHRPEKPVRIADADIDWANTTAWADGGYYARLFLNVAGREPQGVVPISRYESVRSDLVERLEKVVDHRDELMGNRAMRPEDVYPEVNGIAPDLIIYLGDLRWRSVGTVGLSDSVSDGVSGGVSGGLYTFENDTGPDDANHAELGIYQLTGDGLPTGQLTDASIYDVAPTLQRLLRLPAVDGQRGRTLV